MECDAYIRVSTEKQAEEGNGLDSQRRDILSYCERNGMTVRRWYEDDGYSGANMERPALKELISDCMRGKVKNLVAFKLDRISRSMIDGIYMIERVFQPNGVDFRCVHDCVGYTSPMEQAATQMMAVFAQLDKNTMMLRMRGGMLERVKQGYWYGGGNLPYCYNYDPERGILIPIPERAEQANKALSMYIAGYSDARIAKKLGYRTETVVKSILTGVVNVGKIYYKGNIYQGRHDPIFSEDRFRLAQEMRKSRRRSRAKKDPYLLTGLCVCGVCGCRLRYQTWTGGRKALWCCSHDKSLNYLPNFSPDCTAKAVDAETVEREVEREIVKISLDLSDRKRKPGKSRKDALKEQAAKEKRKLSRLYDLYADGNEVIVDKIRETETRIAELEKEANEAATGKETATEKKIKKLANVWDTLSKQEQNTLLKIIIDNIVIVNDDIKINLKQF